MINLLTPRRALAALIAAAAVAGVSVAATAAGDGPAAACDTPSYDGTNFDQHCVIPRVTVPGPTTTAPGPTTTVPGPTTTVPGPTVIVAPPDGPEYMAAYPSTLFLDDFASADVTSSKWNVRNNTWAKNELSIVTSRPRNVRVSDGVLTLRAQREPYTVGSTTRQFTSGYLDTIDHFSARPPFRIDARMKLPISKGLWPALWLRGDASAGEIDILEAVGGWAKAAMTVHQSTNGDMAKLGYEWTPPADWTWIDWHVYGFEWDDNGAMRWYVDGKLILTRSVASVDNKGNPASWLTGPAFASPFNIRLNLQVGGSMPNYYGLPVDSTTQLPADLAVDYVAVRGR